MTSKPEWPSRRSIRLAAYDYASPGAYFVTMLAWQPRPLFGTLVEGRMQLTNFGRIARESLEEIPEHFPAAHMDEYIVMPDHVHALIFIDRRAPTDESAYADPPSSVRAARSRPGSLGTILGSYKSDVTRRINRVRGTPGGRVWTRNYHERIVRTNATLASARRYILENVQKGMGRGKLARSVSRPVGATRLYYRG
jgi:REP element-mobilizing transposase RayT